MTTPDLRDGLLGAEPLSAGERDGYDAALRELFDRELGRAQRLRYGLTAGAGLVLFLGLTSLAVTEPETTPLGTRALLLALAGLGALWFLVCGPVLRRGRVRFDRDRRRMVRLACAACLLHVAWLGWLAVHDPSTWPGLVLGLAFLVAAGVLAARHRRADADLRRRAHVLTR